MSVSAFKGLTIKLFLYHKSPQLLTVRYARNRHRYAKFTIMNTYQPWPKPLEIQEIIGGIDMKNPSELRDELRRQGLLPFNTFKDTAINLSCTTGVFDDYIPPEGDGKSSLLSVNQVKDTGLSARVAVTNLNESRKIRKYDKEFSRSKFVDVGDQMYKEMLSLLPNHADNQGRLLQIVTEKALGDMLGGLHNKTLVHRFIRNIEPTRLVKVHTERGITEGQLFAQITLRIFSEQVIGIFDRFGRLNYGSDSLPIDVLEYVVFEKLVTEEFGTWRIHAKIIPEWMPKKLIYQRTIRDDSDEQSAQVD